MEMLFTRTYSYLRESLRRRRKNQELPWSLAVVASQDGCRSPSPAFTAKRWDMYVLGNSKMLNINPPPLPRSLTESITLLTI